MSKKHHKKEEQNAQQAEPVEAREAIEELGHLEEQTASEPPDYYDKYVRMCADFENFRKRTEREKAALIEYGKKEFADKMLPAYEVMLRQRQKLTADNPAEVNDIQGLKDGLKMLLDQMEKAFKAEGIERMDVLDKPYDPQTSEAIAMIPSSAEQDGFVLEEVQMGFTMDGKILRPARVVVGKGSEEA